MLHMHKELSLVENLTFWVENFCSVYGILNDVKWIYYGNANCKWQKFVLQGILELLFSDVNGYLLKMNGLNFVQRNCMFLSKYLCI